MKSINFLTGKNKLVKLKTSFILSILGLVLASNVAKAQNTNNNKDSIIQSKIKKELVKELPSTASINDSTIHIFQDDGFYKVVYLQGYAFSNDNVSEIPTIEIFNTDGVKLDFINITTNIEYIKKVNEFPKILSKYFNSYLVLEIKNKQRVYFMAFDTEGKRVGEGDNLVDLKYDIERIKGLRNFKYKPKELTMAEKKLKQELLNTR